MDSLDDEIRHHIDEEVRENIERGMSPEEARRIAFVKFGNTTRVRENSRAVWIPEWIDQTLQDGRYSLRLLRRNPGFSAVVVLTVALAIGLNTAVFSVLNAVLLRPLSYPDSDRLFSISTKGPGIPFNLEAVAAPDFADWRESASSFEAMAAYTTGDTSLSTPESTIRAQTVLVSDDFWRISGARAALGRLPNPGETDVLVLTDAAFRRWFHSDPNAAGRVVPVDGRPTTIAGVLPPSFLFELPVSWGNKISPRDVDGYGRLHVPPCAKIRPTTPQGAFSDVIGKLRPGISAERARVELDGIRKRVAAENPGWRPNRANLLVMPVREKLVGKSRYGLVVLFAAVALVLLVACANIAGLMLARISVRRRELAIRASLGAGQGRVTRQLLTESAMFGVLGGAMGLVVAHQALTLVTRLLPDAAPRLEEASLDASVFLFTAALSIAAAILFGVGPVAVVCRQRLHEALKEGAPTASADAGGLRIRRVLVALQVALALVLLMGAGLMVKSLWRMYAHPDGLHPERILTMKVQLYGSAYRDVVKQRAYAEQLLRRLASISGVEAATITTPDAKSSLKIEGALPLESGRPLRMYVYNVTSAGFAKVMGMQLVRGQWFSDVEPGPVVAVNESFARQEFGASNPIGARVHLPGPGRRVASIAAVVRDMRYAKLDVDPEPELYVPYAFAGDLGRMTVMVKTTGDPMAAALSIRKAVMEVDSGQPLFDVMRMEESMGKAVAPRWFQLLLLGAFSVVALLLALIGIYGMISYSVAVRTREIGLRIALGAGRGQVVRMVLGQGAIPMLAGLLAGIAVTMVTGRLVAGLLYGVSPTDASILMIVGAILTLTGLAACAIPALRAAGIEPSIALRSE